MAFGGVFNGKRVLVTGHAGFKGSWLSLWLNALGAKVCGYSLLPDTEFSAYREAGVGEILECEKIADIRDSEELESFFRKARPEIVFHLAAQPLVRLSYSEPKLTYETNVLGTLNVFEAARKCGSVAALVNVTTDKCYENPETGRPCAENDPMGGYDMYSSSKACSEILTSSYRRSFLEGGKPFALASARAGNVIGGGDWARDRLVPDCVRALSQGRPAPVRNPDSVRPWQHVLEPLAGYMRLAQKLLEDPARFSCGFNFGPDSSAVLKVGDIVEILAEAWGGGTSEHRAEPGAPHEAKLLSLDISKAERELGVRPVMNAAEAVAASAKWYKRFYALREPMRGFTLEQIDEFEKKARAKNIEWSF